MGSSRWNRTPAQLLQQRVAELESLLAQARTPNDLHALRDMLSRAGIAYAEEPSAEGTTVTVDDGRARLVFGPEGRLLRLI